MIENERESRHEHILNVARQMMTAARTAPKGKGVDIIEIAMVTDSNIRILSETMKQMYEDNGLKFFLRDADNILDAECIILIGTRELPQGLNCGHCGFPTCADRLEGVPCAINSVDVGIAIGSACATAADNPGGYTCDVFCRTGCPAVGLAGRLHPGICHTGECILQKSIFRP